MLILNKDIKNRCISFFLASLMRAVAPIMASDMMGVVNRARDFLYRGWLINAVLLVEAGFEGNRV